MRHLLDMQLVTKAFDYAQKAHDKQYRKNSKEPYFNHAFAVALLVVSYKGKSKFLTFLFVAAILHDVIEDTSKHIDEIRRLFGDIVANLVIELTNNLEEMKRFGGKTPYLKHKLVNMSGYAFLIKLCDRLHNMSDNPTQKMLLDTVEIIEYVKAHRENITKKQHELINDILTTCKTKLEDY